MVVIAVARGLRPRLALLTLTLVVMGTVGVWLVARGTDGAEAQAVAQETRATLGVFRDARVASDEMPGTPQAELAAADDLQPGENLGLSRRVSHPEGPAFLWPMARGVCHSSPAGSGCTPIRAIRERGVEVGVQTALDLESRTYEDVRVFGIARDGVQSVRLRLHGGEAVHAEVRGNTFLALDLPDRPASVSWEDEQGSHELAIPGPTAESLAEEIAGR